MTEHELKQHAAREHGGDMSKAERRQALTIPINFQVGAMTYVKHSTGALELGRYWKGKKLADHLYRKTHTMARIRPRQGAIRPSSSAYFSRSTTTLMEHTRQGSRH